MDWVFAIGLWFLFFGAILIISGLAILFALLRGARPNGAILAGSLAGGLFFTVFFGLSLMDGKGTGLKEMQGYLDQNLRDQMTALKSEGVPQDKIDENLDWAEKFGVQAYPAWVALTAIWFSFMAYYTLPILFRRFNSRVPAPLPFRYWIIPEPLVFGFIAGALLKISVKYISGPNSGWIEILADNLLVLFGCLYIMGGFSIISYYLQKWNIPLVFRFPLYLILIFLFEPLFCLGLMDVWMDVRKIKFPPLEKTA